MEYPGKSQQSAGGTDPAGEEGPNDLRSESRGCGNSVRHRAEDGTARAQDTIEIKVTNSLPTTHYLVQYGFDIWVAALEKELNERANFTIYPAQQLRKAAELFHIAANAVADLALIATSYHPAQLTVSAVAELPGMYDDICVASRASRERPRRARSSTRWTSRQNDVRTIYNSSLPIYKVLTGSRKIDTLEDLKGVKWRATGSAIDATAQSLSAAEVRLLSTELFQAPQHGSVDGALYLHNGMPPYGLQTVFKHSTEGVSMGSTHIALLMRRDKFDALPDDVRETCFRQGITAAENNSAWMTESETDVRDRMLSGNGPEVTTLGEEEMARWEERAATEARERVDHRRVGPAGARSLSRGGEAACGSELSRLRRGVGPSQAGQPMPRLTFCAQGRRVPAQPSWRSP